MNMRQQFVATTEKLLEQDDRLVTLLGDIGIFGFRHAMKKYPDRVYNIGILEQATISVAAGLALCNLIPLVHTIAPFLVERAYEQLKLDFGYQQLGGNFVSVGASYDYSKLGSTHSCPADVGVLRQIPGMQIILPGTAEEFDTLFCSEYQNGSPTYYRLSERQNQKSYPVRFGKAEVIQTGHLATIVVIGSMLNCILEAARELDVTILYYTTIQPFDQETLQENCSSKKVLLCEPYYSGVLTNDILQARKEECIQIHHFGIPHQFISEYGTVEENDKALGITVEQARNKIEALIKA